MKTIVLAFCLSIVYRTSFPQFINGFDTSDSSLINIGYLTGSTLYRVKDVTHYPSYFKVTTSKFGLTKYDSTINDGTPIRLLHADNKGNVKISPISSVTTSNVSEGSNLYFTDSRSRSAISITTSGSGVATYSSVTGVLNVPQYQSQLSGTGFIKASGTSITYDNSTYLTAEIDGSTTNEIELPSQTSQSGKVLSTNGSSPSWITLPSVPGNNNASAYSAGTVYNITTTPAKIDFGTTDPVVTIPAAGTYLIISNVRVDYSGLTNVAANTVTVKLRRTNNTPADLTNATGDFVVPPVTLLTATGGDCDVNSILYTTSNSNDVIELWASRSGSISVGQIQAGNAWIIAVRIY